MKVLCIIPARMGSKRFPGKPMKKICDIPMIGHCFMRSKMSSLVDDVYVASCDDIILNYIKSINGKSIITSSKHERASERVYEALINLEKINKVKYDIVIMVQGDEPLVQPSMIDKCIDELKDKHTQVSNLMVKLKTNEEVLDINNVKVVFDKNLNALYMSREPIPSNKLFNNKIDYFRQLGLIAFKSQALRDFYNFKQSDYEIYESVDMNRLIENGFNIKMIETNLEVDAVDTVDDLNRVNFKMKNDKLFKVYSKKNYD